MNYKLIQTFMKKIMLLYILFVITLYNVSAQSTDNAVTFNTDKYTNMSIKTYTNPDSSWCFEIFNEEKLIIRQPHIPSIIGVHGFNSQEDAIKIAELMIFKIQNNIFPPSIERKDLDSLKIVLPVK